VSWLIIPAHVLVMATILKWFFDSPGRKAGDRTAKDVISPVDPWPSGLGCKGHLAISETRIIFSVVHCIRAVCYD
jgi:hypothetical protein